MTLSIVGKPHLYNEEKKKKKEKALGCLEQGFKSLGVDTAVNLTLALVSRAASASAAMALCMATGILTSLTSTQATLIPHCSVALLRIALGQTHNPSQKAQ